MTEVLGVLVPMLILGGLLSLAYLAERPDLSPLAWLVYGLLAFLDLGLLFLGASFGLFGLLAGQEALAGVFNMPGSQLTPEGAQLLAAGLPMFGWLMAVAGLLGLMLLWRPIRAAAARWIPIDPGRLVHLTALHYAVLAVVLSGMTAVFLPALIAGDNTAVLEQLGGSTIASLVGQSLGFVIVAFLGVGLFVARGPGAALERLGLTRRFDWRWWLGGTAVGLGSAWLVQLGWQALAPGSLAEVERISEALFKPLLALGIWGAVLAGVLPAISEELLFRGAAQPRFSLLLTALLFMVVHAQYTLSPALAQILAMGLILGMVRDRVNTTTAIAVHGTYNFIVFYLGL